MNDQKEQFFVETVRARRQSLYRIAFHILHAEADAEDAVSAAVENTWRHLARIRAMEAVPAYLMRSVVNAAHDELRRRKRLTSLNPMEDILEAPEGKKGIGEYVSGLEEKYRLPLLLKFDEELQEKEIAMILHIPRGTVSSRISRALKILREEMSKEENGHV